MDNREQLHIKGLSIDWDKIESRSYLREIGSISGIDHLEFHKPITFFVGENGNGKSTLLEAIAVAYGFNPGARYTDERGSRINTVFLRKEATFYTPFTPLKVNSRR